MSLKRNVSLGTGLRYRGGSPYLTYILHRIGGSALFIFFTFYILSLLGIGFARAVFGNLFFQLILLRRDLLNGSHHITVIQQLDIFPKWIEHFRTAINIEWVAYAIVAGFALLVLLRSAWGG